MVGRPRNPATWRAQIAVGAPACRHCGSRESHPDAILLPMAVTLGAPPARKRGPARSRQFGVVVSGALTGVHAGLVHFYLDELLRSCLEDRETMVVLEGGRSGADRAAQLWVRAHHHEVGHVQIAPDWRSYGRSAECIANQMLLDAVAPVAVLVFCRSMRRSYRARDLVARAEAASISYLIIGGMPPEVARFMPDPAPGATRHRQGVLFGGYGTPSAAWRRRMDRAACSLFRD